MGDVKRNVYLNMVTMAEALNRLLTAFPDLGAVGETVAVEHSVGRILAKPVTAKVSSPAYHASAMDGIAVIAADTYGASPAKPKELVYGVSAFPVNTGHVLPGNTNAVIMIEQVVDIGEGRLRIESPAYPWQYVRKTGEDIVATELLFPHGHRVSPYCLGALIAGGVFEVPVLKKPKLLIIPTGSELVDFRGLDVATLKPGQVIESNAYVLKGLAEKSGADAERHPFISDDRRAIADVVAGASMNPEWDMILLVGGSSAGSEDYARAVLEENGTVYVHGVAMMPGKPFLFGAMNNKPVFGIPGYPVSAILAFENFVVPLIHRMLGVQGDVPPRADVLLTRKIVSKPGLEEFVRIKIGKVGDKMVATPLEGGSGSITSLTEADGILRIPANVEGVNAHVPVRAELLKPVSEIENTIVIVGSHDNTLDVLADQIRSDSGRGHIRISSSHVGSMGGLMSLKRGLSHLAGAHLLDESDGSYNLSYIRKYLPEKSLTVVNLVMREQGLIVPKGNPKGITGVEDLARNGLRFVNRQAGSGTRILMDFKLKELGLDSCLIEGYDLEEYTHMSVAVAVLSGVADAGLGIYAAARALDLEFVPVVTEQYDLVVDNDHIHTPNMKVLLDTINSGAFRERVMALGGYGTEKTGTIIT